MFKLDFNTKLDYYVAFLIIIKSIFFVSALGHLLLSHTNSQLSKYDPSFLYWKERTEFIFIISMSILLIYYFYPAGSPAPISFVTKLLFFLFGWILIVTADWKIFVTETPWFQKFVNTFR